MGTEESERAQIIEILKGLGVPESEVPVSLDEAAAMAADAVFARGDRYSLREIAENIGENPEDVAQGFLHLGIHVHDVDEGGYNERDIEFAAFLRDAIADVLTDDEGQEILHVSGTALASIAEAAVASHVQGPERRTANMVENARLNELTAELGLSLGDNLSVAFRHHLRQAAITNRRTQSLEHRELVTLAIGFLDLVGFTTISQELPVNELVDLVKAFERRAHELAHQCRTRIVKLIGDEVMFVAEQPSDAARFVSGMTESLADDAVVPRGGLAHGDLINIHGDYFGPVVNLAARLTDAAVPGEVLVDEAMALHVSTEPAGRRMLKGFDEPIRVHTLISHEES
ncbi:MAG: adenylate/guanylate cyclase domain-containing protein [Acidimicrobiales bacterium]